MKRLIFVFTCLAVMLVLCCTASAFSIFDDIITPDNVLDDIQGTAPIASADACYLYQQYTGCTADVVNSQCVFVEDDVRMVVWVYDTYGVQQDAVCYNADGMIYSYGLNYAVTAANTDFNVIGAVVVIFDISKIAFDFLVSIPLVMLFFGIGFCFTGLALVCKGMRVSKNI